MNVIAWILFGTIAGIVAHAVDTKPAQGGLLGSVVFGISGALIGGFIANVLFSANVLVFDPISLILAAALCLFLLLVHRTALSL